MTGVLPIRNYASESPLSNFYEYNIFDTLPLEKCYGFTLDEVESLCTKYGMDFDEMKRWYDGYVFEVNPLIQGKRLTQYIPICNPNSVVRSVLSGTFECYWNDTGSLDPVRRYVQMDIEGTKNAIVQMNISQIRHL